MKLGEKNLTLAHGINISNVGAKMSYSNTSKRDFIPVNLRLGTRATMEIDKYNTFSLSFDLNKLLVPTPAVYQRDSNNLPVLGADQSYLIGAGSDPDRGLANGIFGSFSDAPGTVLEDEDGNYIQNEDGTYAIAKWSRLKEELSEINIAAGVEWWYNDVFALRSGIFYESKNQSKVN